MHNFWYVFSKQATSIRSRPVPVAVIPVNSRTPIRIIVVYELQLGDETIAVVSPTILAETTLAQYSSPTIATKTILKVVTRGDFGMAQRKFLLKLRYKWKVLLCSSRFGGTIRKVNRT